MNPNILIKNQSNTQLSIGSEASQQMLVYKCADVLQKKYPPYMWAIQMSPDASVIMIRCLDVSSDYGYILHTMTVQNDPDLKCVVTAGGEILERGYQKRNEKEGTDIKVSPVFDLTAVLRKRLAHQKLSEKVNIMAR